MASLEEAFALVDGHCAPLAKISLPLEMAGGYALARDYAAPEPNPRFDMSAMDGFAVRSAELAQASADAPVRLPLQARARAGDGDALRLGEGSTIKIMTGAPIPLGADAVVMQERVEERENAAAPNGREARFFAPARAGDNVRRAGEEFKAGDVVLRTGTLVTPPVAGLLAALGAGEVCVRKKPKVGVIVSGSELRAPDETLGAGQIRDANSFALRSALQGMGIATYKVWRTPDDAEQTRAAAREALACCDVVLTTGGVSAGEYDMLKDAFAAEGVETVFWKVAIKPGKPVYFGAKTSKAGGGKTLIFGLPGNPVAALLNFSLFARRALLRLQGLDAARAATARGILSKPLRVSNGRAEFLRGVMNMNGRLTVAPLERQESHLLTSLAQANCWIVCHGDCETLEAGSEVDIIPLLWNQEL